jgi:hypothetical protein
MVHMWLKPFPANFRHEWPHNGQTIEVPAQEVLSPRAIDGLLIRPAADFACRN